MSKYEYEHVELIGAGTYGKVYKSKIAGDRRNPPTYFAIKKSLTSRNEVGVSADVLREISTMNKLRDAKHVVTHLDAYTDDRGNVYIVLDLASSDLHSAIATRTSTGIKHLLSQKDAKRYIGHILEGLQEMYNAGISHRDLKPGNVLLFNDPSRGKIAKIADFGLSRKGFRGFNNQSRGFEIHNDWCNTTAICTLWYRAPELLYGCKCYDAEKVDIWSVGMIMLEMFDCTAVRGSNSEWDEILKIHNIMGKPKPDSEEFPTAKYPFFPMKAPNVSGKLQTIVSGKLSDSGLELLSKMLTINPTNRANLKEAIGLWNRWDPDHVSGGGDGDIAIKMKKEMAEKIINQLPPEPPMKFVLPMKEYLKMDENVIKNIFGISSKDLKIDSEDTSSGGKPKRRNYVFSAVLTGITLAACFLQ